MYIEKKRTVKRGRKRIYWGPINHENGGNSDNTTE